MLAVGHEAIAVDREMSAVGHEAIAVTYLNFCKAREAIAVTREMLAVEHEAIAVANKAIALQPPTSRIDRESESESEKHGTGRTA